jgi:tetratricopeptide (TPR) repeat protein
MSSNKQLLEKAKSLHLQGDIQAASSLYIQIVNSDPKMASAWHAMGVLSLQIGRFDLAEQYIAEALKHKKRESTYYYNLGVAQSNLNKLDEAKQSLEKALKLKPNYPDAINGLGLVYQKMEQYDEAISCYRRALRINPKHISSLNNLGNALHITNQFDEAVKTYRMILQIEPTNISLYVNMAIILKDADQLDEACDYANRAIDKGATGKLLATAYNTLGLVCNTRLMLSDAFSYFDKALEIVPDFIEAHINKSFAKFCAGEIDEAWREYFWHYKQVKMHKVFEQFPQPLWQGEHLANKSIVIWAEQGLGDEILFASMFNDVIKQADQCLVECDARLMSLFSRSFPGVKFVKRNVPNSVELFDKTFDYHSPAANLGQYLRNEFTKFPEKTGYLVAEPGRVSDWHDKLSAISDRPKIGICWRSMLSTTARSKHYSTLLEWTDILQNDQFDFVNLQYDNCEQELQELKDKTGITVHDMGVDLLNDLDEAAALTTALDMVISAGTSVASMAGALGKKTYLLLPDAYNWTMLGSEAMPWYKNTTVFIKQPDEQWQDVLLRISATINN